MKRLLVAENHSASAEVVQMMLLYLGYGVTLVHNGRAAVDSAVANPPDAILMDINMPVLDGIGALKLLRADPTTQSIPVLAMTANLQSAATFRKLGFDQLLRKPFSVEQLKNVLEKIFGGDPTERAD